MLNVKDEFQIVPPSVSSHRSPLFVKNLSHSAPHYEKLRKKRYILPTVASLKCEGYPFFEDLPNILEDIKFFYVLFAFEDFHFWMLRGLVCALNDHYQRIF